MKKIVLLIFIAVIAIQSLHAEDLPTPPRGFTWQRLDIKGAFLRPDGWFYKREEAQGTVAYFITKENIDVTGRFQTGLSVNLVHFKKDSAVERGRLMIHQIATSSQVKEWEQTVGPFREFGCLAKATDSTGSSMVHHLALANPKTNALYIITFESPETEWDAAWIIGKQIVDMLAIDDEV